VETPLTEHSTAQSVWPARANSPLMTLFAFFVYVGGDSVAGAVVLRPA